MGARVYLPTLGRFLQVDPVQGGTLNPYVYAHDPVNSEDYSGKFIRKLVDKIKKTMNLHLALIQKAKTASQRVASTQVSKTSGQTLQDKVPTVNGHPLVDVKNAPGHRYVPKEGSGDNGCISIGGGLSLYLAIGASVKFCSTGVYYETSRGFGLKGVDFSLKATSSEPQLGCVPEVSGFAIVGAEIDGGGEREIGIGTPGVSFMNTCTYKH